MAYLVMVLSVYGAVLLDLRAGDTPLAPATRGGELLPETPEARLIRLQQVGKFNEDSVLEPLQSAMLLAMVASGLAIAWSRPGDRPMALLLSGLAGMAAIREQDKWFEMNIRHGAWVYPVSALAILLAFHVWRKRRDLAAGFEEFVHAPSWGFFAGGGFLVLILSRLLGQKFIWNILIENPWNARNIKNLVEEGIESSGYVLLLCGCIEWAAHVRRKKNPSGDVTGRAPPATFS